MTRRPGPGMYGSDGTFIPYISEEEFTAMTDVDYTPDPERFSWFQSGYLRSGTLQEYADIWADRQYTGDDTGLSKYVVYWADEYVEPVRVPVSIHHHHTDEEHWMYHHVSVPGGHTMIGGTAVAKVDGRA